MKPLVKDKRGFLRLESDVAAVMAAFSKSKSRMAEKALADLMDQLFDAVYGTLTDYGAWFVERCGDMEPFEAVRTAQALAKRDRRRTTDA